MSAVATSDRLAGKVALVTGAARGLGRAYALHLATLGADVAVLDADLHSYREFALEQALMGADTTVDEIRDLGRRSHGLQTDVTDSVAVEKAIDELFALWGRIDVLVCNAGGG